MKYTILLVILCKAVQILIMKK